MCNHYRNNARAIEDWAIWAGYKPRLPDIPISDDAWPKRPGYVIRREAGDVVVDVMQWGIPLAMKGKSGQPIAPKPITNVRNLASPFWRSTLAKPAWRCLVPFTSFAESKPGKDPETGRPAEHWFSLPSRAVAAFAGIWRPSPAGNAYALLTTEPNPLVAPLHPKAMPVILHEDDHARWLDGTVEEACALVAPYPSQLMAVT